MRPATRRGGARASTAFILRRPARTAHVNARAARLFTAAGGQACSGQQPCAFGGASASTRSLAWLEGFLRSKRCGYEEPAAGCRVVALFLLASVLQAASPPKAREPWKPRPGDGISSNWLIAELTHHLPDRPKLRIGKPAAGHAPVLLGTCFAWGRAGRAVGLPWYPTAEGPILGPRQHRPQTWSWGNDPPENGQYGAVGRQLSAHRPRHFAHQKRFEG